MISYSQDHETKVYSVIDYDRQIVVKINFYNENVRPPAMRIISFSGQVGHAIVIQDDTVIDHMNQYCVQISPNEVKNFNDWRSWTLDLSRKIYTAYANYLDNKAETKTESETETESDPW